MTAPHEEQVRDALRTVIDPEAGMNVVDLGLVYAIRITPNRVEIDLTLTSPACPMGNLIADESEAAVRRICESGVTVRTNLVWEPSWDPSRMSEEAKRHFGW